MSERRVGFEVLEGMQASKFVALHCVGLLVSLRDGHISFDEAGRFFLPRTIKSLRARGIDSEVVALVCLGCELEDVKSLVPERFTDNINLLLVGFLGYVSRYSSSDFVDVEIKLIES